MPLYRAVATLPPRRFHTMIRTIEITTEVVSEKKAIKDITGLVEGWLDVPFKDDIEADIKLTAAIVPTKPKFDEVFDAFHTYYIRGARVMNSPASQHETGMRRNREQLRASLDALGIGHLIDFETE